MEGVLYYPYIEVPQTPWLMRTLLYWDEVATIMPTQYARGGHFDGFTQELLRRDLLRIARPEDGARQLDGAWWKYLENLEPSDLARRQAAFGRGRVVMLHVEKLFRMESFETACRLGLATSLTEASVDNYGRWVRVETRTANELMAALTIALTHPSSDLARTYDPVRWLPATNSREQLLQIVGSASRFPRSADELHQSRIRLSERERQFQAIVLERLFPVPATAAVDLDELVDLKREFGGELRRLRRHVERRVIEILNNPETDQQVRLVDQIGDEFEDEIRRAEANLRQLRITRITRSTLVQLVRNADPTGFADRAARGAEDIIGGQGAITGPLAYAAFARIKLFGRGDGRPVMLPVLQPPEYPLANAFG